MPRMSHKIAIVSVLGSLMLTANKKKEPTKKYSCLVKIAIVSILGPLMLIANSSFFKNKSNYRYLFTQ